MSAISSAGVFVPGARCRLEAPCDGVDETPPWACPVVFRPNARAVTASRIQVFSVPAGRRQEMTLAVGRQRTASDGIANIAAYHFDIAVIDRHNEIAMAGIGAMVLILVADSGLARPANKIANLRRIFFQSVAEKKGCSTPIQFVLYRTVNIVRMSAAVVKSASNPAGAHAPRNEGR